MWILSTLMATTRFLIVIATWQIEGSVGHCGKSTQYTNHGTQLTRERWRAAKKPGQYVWSGPLLVGCSTTSIIINHYFPKAAPSQKHWRAESVWLPWITAVWTLLWLPRSYSISKRTPETSIKLKKSTFPPHFWRIPAILPAQRSSCPLLLLLKLSLQSECEAASEVLGEESFCCSL